MQSARNNKDDDSFEPENSRILAQVERRCPATVRSTYGRRREWAQAVFAALRQLHRWDDRVHLLHHARSLVFNLKRNGTQLADIPPEVLVSLSPEMLARGTEALRRRRAAQLGGWDPPPLRGSDRDRPLARGSAWRTAIDKTLVLVLNDAGAFRAFEGRFGGRAERVQVVRGDITTVEGPVDAYVSPSNCMGNMDGGIDRVYARHFGWSYGRPFHSPNPLQLAIDEAKGKTEGTLPIGEALVVRHKEIRLIAAPTMALPGKIAVGSRIVYDAATAAFLAWKGADDIGTVRMPAFGTGWGQVPAEVAAWQMWEAFVDAWS